MATRLGATALALLAMLVLPVGGSARTQAAPGNTGEPRVSGRTIQGLRLQTTRGSWTGTAPLSFRYRWLRCDASGGGANGVTCTLIRGATSRFYLLKAADVGHRIRSRVTVSNSEGSASSNSNATPGIVQPASAAGLPAN